MTPARPKLALYALVGVFAGVALGAAVAFADVISCDGGSCRGTGGADEMFGTPGFDAIDSLSGNDSVFGNAGGDHVNAGYDRDRVDGGVGGETIYGWGGYDAFTCAALCGLHGEEGQDDISGNAGDDVLRGGDGPDQLFGGGGHDHCFGGDGDDTFVDCHVHEQ